MLENEKIKNKIKYQLINWIIINSVFLLAFIIFIFLLLPGLDEISEKKDSTNLLVDDYNKNMKSWISFNDFTLEKSSITDSDVYKRTILSNMDSNFYNKHFINNWQDDYKNFLDKLNISVNQKLSSKEFTDKQNLISNILPIYSNSASFSGTITDSMFINNVENLIEKFNLSSSDTISVSNIISAEDVANNTKKTIKSQLDSSIYYFSIPLKLTGTKKDIIDFITYIENVWSITLNWEKISANYNWELADIDSIKISSYLDSDNSTIVSGQDMISFVKNTQWTEKLDIDLTLNFYVKWLASYKVQEYVKTLNINYSKLTKDTQTLISRIDQQNPDLIIVFNKLNSIKRYLDTTKKDISDLVISANKSDDLGSVYNRAYKFSSTITNLTSLLEEQKKIIDSLKINKK